MKLNIRHNKYHLLPIMLLTSFGAEAGNTLDAEAVKVLFVGKTIHARQLVRDFEFRTYFDKDGKTAFRKQAGKSVQTTYSFHGNKACLHWKGNDYCATIVDNGDGTYDRVDPNGRHIIKITKIVDGKDF